MDKKEELNKANKLFDSAEEARAQNEYMKASSLYTKATDLFRNIGGNKEKLDKCKQYIVEMNKLSMKHEFGEHSVTTDISEEDAVEIEKQVMRIAELPLSESLENIGISQIFCPQIEEVAKMASENMPIAFQLASVYSVDDEGNTVRGSQDGQRQWLMKMYSIQLQICRDIYLLPIFNKLLETNKLTQDNLYDYINRHNIISEEKRSIIKRGIKAYFDKDYITALHILVPQFEALFLSICSKIGIGTIKIHRGKKIATETITFSENNLDSDTFKEKWGSDFCELINFLLFRPMGYKIRHRIAHGLIKGNECDSETCIFIIYLYIALSSRVKPNN